MTERLLRLIWILPVLLSVYACSSAGDSRPNSNGRDQAVVDTETPLPTATDTPIPTATPTPTPTPVVDVDELTVELVPFVFGITQPLDIRHAGDGSGRLFIASRIGFVFVVQDGELLDEPFLDISHKVQTGGAEQGLLGLAFHPDFADNGRFFVNYTMSGGDTVIARYIASSDSPNRVNPETEQMLMLIDQPFNNHNGGNLVFGPDGYLYVGVGDGGAAGDPDRNGQDGLTLLATMLRLDVDGNVGYDIPEDNPFVGNLNVRDEVWAIGLRNPWRYSFDRETGDMYLADVGQNDYEEVNFIPADSTDGHNFGWSVMEGLHCYGPNADCDMTGLELPIAEYSHDEGCSIVGGYVYRGMRFPELWGVYFFGDYCSGRIWGLNRPADGEWQQREALHHELMITSFGEDESGELYVATIDGRIFQLVAVP